MASGHNRESTRERKLHAATVASMRLQNAILGPQSAEFNDHCWQQGKLLIEIALRAQEMISPQKRAAGQMASDGITLFAAALEAASNGEEQTQTGPEKRPQIT
jgi:hypothetical protein